MRRALLLSLPLTVVVAIATACATGIKYEKRDDAPDLPKRAANCHVEIMELGRELQHEHEFKITGSLVWTLSAAEQRKLDGDEEIQKRLLAAACEHGLYVVTDIKAYPNTRDGGATYEAKGGVLVDKDGNPIGGVIAPKGATDAGPAS